MEIYLIALFICLFIGSTIYMITAYSGHFNPGKYNSGNRNTGNYNTGYFNSGHKRKE